MIEGRYQKGRGSVDEFLELCAIANPHARITFVPPSRVAADDQEDLPLTNAATRMLDLARINLVSRPSSA